MCFALGCMGLPLQAKGIAPVQPDSAKPSSKSDAKAPAKKTDAKATASTTSTTSKSTSTMAKASDKPTPAPRSTSSSRPTAVASSRTTSSARKRTSGGEHLARLTAYWAGEGDYYTGRGMSSTGIRLHSGHCAVDPHIIPYGSVVKISGLGSYLAVDTGSAVVSREAARETGHNSEERNALVVDIYFESRRDGQRFAASGPKYATITWTPPTAVGANTQESHSSFGEDSATKDL